MIIFFTKSVQFPICVALTFSVMSEIALIRDSYKIVHFLKSVRFFYTKQLIINQKVYE